MLVLKSVLRLNLRCVDLGGDVQCDGVGAGEWNETGDANGDGGRDMVVLSEFSVEYSAYV